jgi:hypothetical protein
MLCARICMLTEHVDRAQLKDSEGREGTGHMCACMECVHACVGLCAHVGCVCMCVCVRARICAHVHPYMCMCMQGGAARGEAEKDRERGIQY